MDQLQLSHDATPVSPTEPAPLTPERGFNQGAMLIRPVPDVDGTNAASGRGRRRCGSETTPEKWNSETTEVTPAPVGVRQGAVSPRLAGRSMGPKIGDGDRIFRRPRESFAALPNGRVVVIGFQNCCRTENMLLCKRLRQIGDRIFLGSSTIFDRDEVKKLLNRET